MPEQLSKATIHRSANIRPGEQISVGSDGRRRLRFLVVGGSTTDHHINPSSGVKLDKSNNIVITGDKIPSRLASTEGGNGYNLAMAFGQLGEAVTLVTPSPSYNAIEKANKERGVDVIALRATKDDETIRQSFVLNVLGTRVIFGEEVDRDYTIDFETINNSPIESEMLPESDVVVLSSVDGASWGTIYRNGTNYAKNHTKLLAVLPSSKQLKDENIKDPDLHYALENANIIGGNRTEIISLLNARGLEISPEATMLDIILLAIKQFGSDKYISITNDAAPSVLATPDGRVLELNSYGDGGKTTTGAGDAYAAALIQALATGRSDEFAIMQAAINGYMATHVVDAQSGHQTQDQIIELIGNAPETFIPIQIFPAPKVPSSVAVEG